MNPINNVNSGIQKLGFQNLTASARDVVKDITLGIQGRLFFSHLIVVIVTALAIYITTCIINPLVLKQTTIASGIAGGVDILTFCAKTAQQSLLWGLGISVALAALISFLVADRLVRPLKKMQHASNNIANGNYEHKLDESMPGELGILAKTHNHMAKQLAEVESQRVTLISNLSHELSTPLSSLKGFVEGIEDGFFEANQQTMRACQRQIGRLERLIRDLSLVSRVEAGAYELNQTQFNVKKLLLSCETDALINAKEKKVQLQIDCPDDLKLTGDSQRLEQVIGNLVHNAIKHSKENDTVTLSATEKDNTIELAVTDTGEGIPQISLKHLFSRFYQVDKARKQMGSGIGLTIAKHFTEAHGGNLSVESKLGQGSCFTVHLPNNIKDLAHPNPKATQTTTFKRKPSHYTPLGTGTD